jgi:preprotein translocase subunit YajC
VLLLAGESASTQSLVASAYKAIAETDQEKIDQLRSRLATNSSELKAAASKISNTHIFGTISAIAQSTIVVETQSGTSKMVFTDDLTKFYSLDSSGKTIISLTDLKVSDPVSVVGIGNDDTSGTAKYIVRQGTPVAQHYATAGKVKEVSTEGFVITNIVNTTQNTNIKLNSNTTVKIKGKNTATVTDIKVGDLLVLTGNLGKDGSLEATKIFVLPGKATGAKPKESTSSATPSAQP